jgi:hypothetical protein
LRLLIFMMSAMAPSQANFIWTSVYPRTASAKRYGR